MLDRPKRDWVEGKRGFEKAIGAFLLARGVRGLGEPSKGQKRPSGSHFMAMWFERPRKKETRNPFETLGDWGNTYPALDVGS